MSGRKVTYTTISDDELNRLRRQASQASTLSRCNQALQDLSSRNDQIMRQQRQRIDALNTTVSNLNTALANQTAAVSSVRRELRTQIQNVLSESDRRLDRAMRTATERMNEQASALNGRMDALQHQVAAQVESVNTRVQRVEANVQQTADQLGVLLESNATLLDLAREYAGTARTINGDTAANYRTELLLPGRLRQVQDLIDAAEQEIRDAADKMPTNAPVARHSARAAAAAAIQLHEDMVRAEQQWQLRYQAAAQALNTARAQIDASRSIRLPDCDVDVDVDYWSNGDLTALEQRRQQLGDQLADSSRLTGTQLEGICQAGEQLTQEARDAAVFAAVALQASQDRSDVAQDLADYLSNALGLTQQVVAYQSGDQRAAHRLYLKNPVPGGFEMVVTQYPEVDAQGRVTNRLESDILNYGTNNEEEGDNIARQALSRLSGLGLASKPVETVQGYERRTSDRTRQSDMGAWRRERAQVPAAPHAVQTGNNIPQTVTN